MPFAWVTRRSLIGVVLDFVPAHRLTRVVFEPTKSFSVFALHLSDDAVYIGDVSSLNIAP